MRNKRELLFMTMILNAFLSPGETNAGTELRGCRILVTGLAEKMSEYRAHRRVLEQTKSQYESQLVDCRSVGQEISAGAAATSVGEACKAVAESAALNSRIQELGKKCDERFSRIKTIQGRLRESFEGIHRDLAESMTIIRDNPILKEECPDEVSAANTMTQAFLTTEAGIMGLGADASRASGEHASLRSAAQAFASEGNARSSGCEGMEDSIQHQLSERGRNSRGQGSVTELRNPRTNGQSDITGTEKKEP